MIKRKTMDIITFIFFFLVVLFIAFNSFIFSSYLSPIQSIILMQVVIGSLIFIYFIFTFVLVIQLYSNKKSSIADIFLVVIFGAFAIFYYLFSFRKKLKEFEFESNNPNKQTNYYQDNQETTYSENTSAY